MKVIIKIGILNNKNIYKSIMEDEKIKEKNYSLIEIITILILT